MYMAHKIPDYKGVQYVTDKTTVDILWKQLKTLQDVAEEFGIENIFQDNGAEILQQLIYLNMKAVPGREGNDGVDINGCEWEMKSLDVSKGNSGITTNHHLNADIIEKYKTVPWSVAIYDRIHLKKIYIVGSKQLQATFQAWEQQLRKVKSLNNPKIPLVTIEEQGTLIYEEGWDFPVDPMEVLDTKPYIPLQKAYFVKTRKQREAIEAERTVAKAKKALSEAREACASAEKEAQEKENAAQNASAAEKKNAEKAYKEVRQKADRSKKKVTNRAEKLSRADADKVVADAEARAAAEAFAVALQEFYE